MAATHRIAEHLHKVFHGDAWHGPALSELMVGVDVKVASAAPKVGKHTVWEIVNHIRVWVFHTRGAMRGLPLPLILDSPEDWPPTKPGDAAAWDADMKRMFDEIAVLKQ